MSLGFDQVLDGQFIDKLMEFLNESSDFVRLVLRLPQ